MVLNSFAVRLETVRGNLAIMFRRSVEAIASPLWVVGKYPPNSWGSMEILMFSTSLGVRLDTIRVGKRVQSRSATGNGMSVKLCSKEDFPAD